MFKEPHLSRRMLLKAGMAGASCIALGGSLMAPRGRALAGEAGEYVSLTTGRVLTGTPTSCGLCPAGCGVLAFVDAAGRPVGLAGNPRHPVNRGSLCAQGSAAMNLLRSRHRVRAPLRRVGGRGEGKWEPVSWDLALSALTAALQENLGPERRRRGSLAVSVPERRVSPFLERLVSFFPGGLLEVSDGYELAAEREVHRAVWGVECGGAADLVNADVVLNFGADLLGNVREVLPAARGWSQGKRGYARWFTLDPRLSETAVASNRWIPLRPGTDGAFASAVAAWILEQGREDPSFLKHLPPGEESRIRGVLAPCSPERAARICGVPADIVVEAAEAFSVARRAVAVFGNGVLARENAARDAGAVLLLNLLTGNVNREGGYRFFEPGSWMQADPVPGGSTPFVLPGTLFRDLERGRCSVDTLISLDANPAATDPGGDGTAEVLKSRERVPFHVALASVWNETCHLADLVLPAATYLAEWGLCRGVCPSNGTWWAGLRQPVFPPEGESRPAESVLLEAVLRLGDCAASVFPFADAGGFYAAVVTANVSDSRKGAGMESLRAKGFAALPGEPVPAARLSSQVVALEACAGVFGSPVTTSSALSRNHSDSVDATAGASGSEKTLLLFASPLQGADALGLKWVEEIEHNRPVWMHPATAAEVPCSEGDWVRVRGPAGEVRTRVRLTEGLHPEAVAMCMAGVGMESGDVVPGGKEREWVWWHGEIYGGNVRKLVPWPTNPERTCPGWEDTRVTISKWVENV